MKAKGTTTLILVIIFFLAALFAGTLAVLAWDLNLFKPLMDRTLSSAIGRSVAINGSLEMDWGLPPAFVARNVRVANAGWASPSPMVVLQQVEAWPDWAALLVGRTAFDKITIRGADLMVEQNTKNQWNLPRTVDAQTASTTSGGNILSKLNILDSSIRLRTKGQNYHIVLKDLNLVFGKGDSPTTAHAALSYEGTPVDIVATLSPTRALFQGKGKIDLDLALKAENNHFTAKGVLSSLEIPPRVDIRFKVDAPDLDALAALKKLPDGFRQTLQAGGHLFSLDGKGRYRLSDFRLISGSNDARGWIELAPFAKPMMVKSRLSSKVFDLRQYWSQKKARESDAKSAEAENKAPLFSSEPLDWSLLKEMNTDTIYKADVLKLPHMALQNLVATLSINNGRLDLEPFMATVGGGNFQAETHLDITGSVPKSAIVVTGKAIDLEKMLKVLNLPASIRGKIGFDINVKGKGESPDQIASSLDGHFSLVMQGGELADRYLQNAELYNFTVTKPFLDLFTPGKKKKSGFTDINCAVCSFAVDSGLAQSNVLVFDTDRAGVVGDGQVNLKNERLDIALKPVTRGGIGIPGLAQLNLGTGPLAESFKLGGTLSEPAIELNKSATAFTLGKAIGGMLLLGPAGLASALLETRFGDDNPCIKALKTVSEEEKKQKPQ